MLVSLVLAAALPTAFGSGGLVVAGAFATMQIGRAIFAIPALGGEQLQRTFERILVWSIVIACLWLLGALWLSQIGELVWALAVAVDFLGGAIGFYTPGPGAVPDKGVDHRGQSVCRTLPGLYPDRHG
jgi:low temperature requirement protein LtrA